MRLFSHPIHPILVAFPIAFLALTPILDGLSWFGVVPDAVRTAYVCELAGVIGGGLAIVTGLVEFAKIGQDQKPAVKTALVHASLAAATVSLFVVAFALRGGAHAAETSPAALALEIGGALVLAATGWFGGHLVFHHGIAVERR